jgi:hypothetical protein
VNYSEPATRAKRRSLIHIRGVARFTGSIRLDHLIPGAHAPGFIISSATRTLQKQLHETWDFRPGTYATSETLQVKFGVSEESLRLSVESGEVHLIEQNHGELICLNSLLRKNNEQEPRITRTICEITRSGER